MSKLTRVTKLEIKGFKSFANKTELVFGEKYNCVLGPNGSGKSISYSSVVTLSNGEEVQIGKLIENRLEKAQDVKTLKDGVYCDGDDTAIISINPITMKTEVRKISKYVRRNGEKLFKIITRSGRSVKATGCHPVMIFKDSMLKSVLIRDLHKNDLIATPRSIMINSSSVFDADKARLLGYIIGDGYVGTNRIDLVNADEEIIKDYEHLVSKLYPNYNLRKYYNKNKFKTNTITLTIYNKDIVREIRGYFGEYLVGSITSSIKKIPDVLLSCSDDVVRNVLAGMFDTDGSVRKDANIVELCSKNHELIYQVQRLLLRFNILSKIKKRICYAYNTKDKIKREYFFLYIYGIENINRFYMNIPLKCAHKNVLLTKICKSIAKSNPNVDLLPKETNKLIKKAVDLLGLKVKLLRKEYPKLAAYVEDRCCPSRDGLNEILSLFNEKFDSIKNSYHSTNKDVHGLITTMDNLNISGRTASTSIGISQQIVRDYWQTGKFSPREQNLNNFYTYINNTLKTRIAQLTTVLNSLFNIANSDIFWDEIVEITESPEEKFVYDLTIDENHNFIGNGIFVHNSNVMDALCFVLGKGSSKDMRAEKSSNLIYNGGKLKNPSKEGEVSIFFDNHDKVFPEIKDESKRKKPEAHKYVDEIKLTRLIKENGQSVYKINDRTKTRQEILDLMAFAKINPDGYNIVLQGEIVNLIEMTPLSRREMLEQIAGLSLYEEKKEKALRELQRVEEKMSEVEIILAERKTHLTELKRDRDQALKFKDLNDKIKRNKATILDIKMQSKTIERDKYSKDIDDGNSKINRLHEESLKLKESIEQKKHEIDRINMEIEERGEKEQVAIHKEVEKLKIELALDNQRLTGIESELSKIIERKNQLQNSLNDIISRIGTLSGQKKELDSTIDAKDKELVQIQLKIDKFLEKNNLNSVQQIDKEIEQIDKDSEVFQDEIQKLREGQQSIIREKDKQELILKNIDESIENVLKLEKENKEQVETLKKKKEHFKKTTLELNTQLSENSSLAMQLENARSRILSRKEELVKLNARDMSLRENLAAGVAVQRILEMKETKKGIYGLVSNLGNVKQEYALALEVAAGQRIRSIVVDDDKIAAECIKYLKDNKLGIATFLPMNKIRSVQTKPELKNLQAPGIKGLAIDLIDYDPKFAKVFSYVFENTLIVEDIETARKIGIGNYRMATMSGDLVETSGAMQGGFRQKTGASFQEKELREGIEKLEKEIEDSNIVVRNLEQKRADNEELIGKLREMKSSLDGEIAAMEKTLHLDSDDLDISKRQKSDLKKAMVDLDKSLDDIISKTSDKNKELASLKARKQQLRDRINELRNPALLAELNAFEQKKAQLREDVNNIRQEIKNNDAQISNVLSPEKDNIFKVLKQQEKEKAGFEDEKSALAKKVKEHESILKEKEAAESKFFAQFKELFQQRNKLSEESAKLDNAVFNKQEEARNIEQRINLVSLQAAEVRAMLSGMMEEYKQYEGVELFKDKPESEILKEIAQFEKLIVEIGAVNMRALEIYEKIEKEYKTFIEKKDMILHERGSVLVMINEIDARKKELFMKTYEILDHNFKVIFSALSTKGEASLELEDPNDPFNGGLLLKVRITGTKFLDIKSLSGGEKTMAAIAFIFAVQEYDPAPFYILDEVDAALDKKNSEQLAQLIKNYSSKAQYIIISHNDGIISEADTLYGISMNEFGISKVTSLKI